MLIDAALPEKSLNDIPAIAQMAETSGFAALWSTEIKHDPFLPGPLIFEHTQNLQFGTAIAVAFARSPAVLAYTAWDLAAASGGRFILGLGTQVKAHIERRFGMAWPESVVEKLRQQIQVIRACWKAWQNGTPLNFRGDYYKLTLMPPFFNPGPIEHPNIPIYIAGVNTGLAKLAGETADGFQVHPFHTPGYLAEVLYPAIRAGAQKAGRSPELITRSVTAFAITSSQEEQFVRQQIAFYASTPSYKPVMSLHGWQETADALSHLAARSRWNEMPSLISDEMLQAFAVWAEPSSLAQALHNRYRNLADRVTLYLPLIPGERDDLWLDLLFRIKKQINLPSDKKG